MLFNLILLFSVNLVSIKLFLFFKHLLVLFVFVGRDVCAQGLRGHQGAHYSRVTSHLWGQKWDLPVSFR